MGATERFQAIARDQHGNVMPGVNFDFSSSGSAATVDRTGLAKGLSAGTATITASAGGRSASAALTVAADPPLPPILTLVSVSPSTASIQVGQQQSYTAVGYDQFNNAMSGITFTWSSDSANSIAIVNGNTATGVAAGTVHITASVAAINITSPNAFINVGGTQQFSALATDQHGLAMSGVEFTWTSSDPAVATIDANGLVTGLSEGTAEISASAQGAISNVISLGVSAVSCDCPLTISKLSPPLALAGSGDLVSLTITGSGFVGGALVNFGSNILTPSSVSPTSVVVTVPAAELTSVTPANQPLSVSVTNPAPHAGTSNSMPFSITNHGLVSINFDDGYQSIYDNGLPILDAAGLKSTQYIITQKVGWDGYVTLDEVLQMHNNGHEIGVHTRTHPNLTTLTEAEMTGEIVGAKQDLISWGITPTTLAYPFGGYNPTVEGVVQSAGLRGARDSDLGYNSSGVGLTFGGPLDHDTRPLVLWSEAAEMDMHTTLSDITSEIDYAVANNLWLIILFHRVDETDPCCAPISVDHSLIQGTVDYLVQGRVPVVTNNEGLIIENLNAQDPSELGLYRQDNTKH